MTATKTELEVKGAKSAVERAARSPIGASWNRVRALLAALCYAGLGLGLAQLLAYEEPVVRSVVLEEGGGSGNAIHIALDRPRVILVRSPLGVDFRTGRIRTADRQIVFKSTDSVIGVRQDGTLKVFDRVRARDLPDLDQGFESVRLALEARDPTIREFWARP